MSSQPQAKPGSTKYVTVQSKYSLRPTRPQPVLPNGSSKTFASKSRSFLPPRHSSPNTNSKNPNFSQLSGFDGLTTLGQTRRSLSVDSLSVDTTRTSVQPSSIGHTECRRQNSHVQSDDNEDQLAYEKSTAIAWAKVYEVFVQLFSRQNQTEWDELKKLLDTCGWKRAELRRQQRVQRVWTDWIRKTRSLEAENEILESLIVLLDGKTQLEGPNSSGPRTEGVIGQLRSFTNDQMALTAKLGLEGFPHAGDVNLSDLTTNAQQFAHETQDELCRLEDLASSLEHTVDQLTATDIPVCVQRAEQAIATAQHFAYEASTIMEELQKKLLRSLSSNC